MKIKESKVVMFIATVLLGLLIASNLDFEGIQTSLEMNAKEYQDAIEERSKLYNEISNISALNREKEKKIKEYVSNDKEQEKIYESMKKELGELGLQTGLSEVSGPGVVITIIDGEITEDDTEFSASRKIFHDSDAEFVVNELRNAGAEAIAINNTRLSPISGFACYAAFIKVDDSKEFQPFSFYAIGDPETLKELLESDNSYLERLKARDLKVSFEVKENIQMPASSKAKEVTYMKPYSEK